MVVSWCQTSHTFDLDVSMFNIYIVCTWHALVNIHRYYTLFCFVIAQWTLPNIILIRDIDMFSTYVPISANCLFVYCLLHLCIRMFIVFLCNINHCNDSAPCWDLDWTGGVSVSLGGVMCLPLWFVTLCLWLYCSFTLCLPKQYVYRMLLIVP